jgi:HTH-type transcriptional regulator / antitoxin HigA
MDIQPIHTRKDYQSALREIDALFNAQPGTPNSDRLEVLVALVAAYEEKHHPIPLPDPIEAIQFHMERLGLTRKDLEPYIGTRARVSEVLNRKRPLTLNMIRNLIKGLGIAPEILIQEYPLATTGEDVEELPVNSP